MNHMTIRTRLVLLLGGCVLLAGCMPRGYQADENLGQAVKQDVAMQMAYPQGIPALGPPGLEGQAAKANVDRYLFTFIMPPAPVNALSMGLGSSGGGGQQMMMNPSMLNGASP